MTNKKVDAEYQRLLLLVKDVDETKKQLLDELLKKAAFLKVKMDLLQEAINEKGTMQRYKKTGELKMSQRYKVYLASLATYQQILKTINNIIGKNKAEEDDEFDEFIKGIKGG